MLLNGKKLPLQPLNFTTIPSVYEDNFTFLEELESLYKTVVEIVAFLDDFTYEKIQAQIDASIEILRKYTDDKNDELDASLRAYINLKVEQINEALLILENSLKDYTDNKFNYVVDLINSIKDELEEEIENIIVGNISVRNPTTRNNRPIRKSFR